MRILSIISCENRIEQMIMDWFTGLGGDASQGRVASSISQAVIAVGKSELLCAGKLEMV